MTGQTIRLVGDSQRQLAQRMIAKAPVGAVVNIREATRTNDQNAKMQAMLSDIARAKPGGRNLPTDVWKALAMYECGHRTRFEPALNGDGVVALGFRSSHLTKSQMSDLIETLYAFGSEHGVQWSEPGSLKEALVESIRREG